MRTSLSVGFIGLGHVGSKLATHLLESGHSLSVLDLDDDAAATTQFPENLGLTHLRAPRGDYQDPWAEKS